MHARDAPSRRRGFSAANNLWGRAVFLGVGVKNTFGLGYFLWTWRTTLLTLVCSWYALLSNAMPACHWCAWQTAAASAEDEDIWDDDGSADDQTSTSSQQRWRIAVVLIRRLMSVVMSRRAVAPPTQSRVARHVTFDVIADTVTCVRHQVLYLLALRLGRLNDGRTPATGNHHQHNDDVNQ